MLRSRNAGIQRVTALNDALQEHNDALLARIDAQKEYIDARLRVSEIRQGITLDALVVIRDLFKLLENPNDEGPFFKFVGRRNDLDGYLDALREDEQIADPPASPRLNVEKMIRGTNG